MRHGEPWVNGARAPSLWLDPPPWPGRRSRATVDADVVVIGAGYTGLWTALALRERGADVVVLERDYAGFGASGRNAGHLTPTIGKDLPTLLRLYGRERGGALVRFAEAAVEHVEAAIAERGIDCDYVAAGNVLAGVHPGQRPALEKAAEAAGSSVARCGCSTAPELAERGLPPLRRLRLPRGARRRAAPGQVRAGAARAGDRGGVRGSTSRPRWTRSPTGPGCGWRRRAAR